MKSSSISREIQSTAAMSTKIMLIACGSFNPPTPMHLRMFGERFLQFSRVFFLFTISQPFCRNRQRSFHGAGLARGHRRNRVACPRRLRQERTRFSDTSTGDAEDGSGHQLLDQDFRLGVPARGMDEDEVHASVPPELSQLNHPGLERHKYEQLAFVAARQR